MSAVLGNNFYPKLVQVASEVGMAPEDLIAVMISESGMKPSAGNPNGGAVGLIQFMPGTLKGLNFKGTSKDFGNLNGEDQLDYIKKYVSNQMKLNGGPFTSAAQYYVANFFPIALKLPGIKKGDPSTPFVEEDPQVVVDGGKKYSKKYYDIGIKLNPHSEIAAYKANPGFHGSVPGKIIYADMIKQIEKNKKSSNYTAAINSIKSQTNYIPNEKNNTSYVASNKPMPSNKNNSSSGVLDLANKFVQMLSSAEAKKSYFLVRISSDKITSSEFGRIVSMAVKEEFDCKSIVGENEILIHANKSEKQINDLLKAIQSSFKIATKKIGSIDVEYTFNKVESPSFNSLNSKIANQHYRRFLLKFCRAE